MFYLRWTYCAIQTKLKEFSPSIEKILSTFPSSKNIFPKTAIYHKNGKKNSEYKPKIQRQQLKENNHNKKKRKCNIIWFSTLYYHRVSSTELSLVCHCFMDSRRELNHGNAEIFISYKNKAAFDFFLQKEVADVSGRKVYRLCYCWKWIDDRVMGWTI